VDDRARLPSWPGPDAGLSPADHQRLFGAGLDWLLAGFTTTLTDGSR